MSIKKQLDISKPVKIIKGQAIFHEKRYADDTRHMVIFDITIPDSSTGDVGDRIRVFLNDDRYKEVQQLEKQGKIEIISHCHIIKGRFIHESIKQLKYNVH